MAVTFDLPDDVVARLQAEASRRGISVDAVVAELAAQLPADGPARRHRLSFIGIGASGRTEPMDIRRERAELAARKAADGR